MGLPPLSRSFVWREQKESFKAFPVPVSAEPRPEETSATGLPTAHTTGDDSDIATKAETHWESVYFMHLSPLQDTQAILYI